MNKNTWQFVLPSLTPETKNEQMKNENGFMKIDFLNDCSDICSG